MALTQAPAPPLRDREGRTSAAKKRRRSGPAARREGLAGYVFLSPWLIGFFGITAAPMLYSLYISFTDHDTLVNDLNFPGPWIGFENYIEMFTIDPQFWHAVEVTVTYALTSVPLKLAAALGVAMLLVRDRRGNGVSRALFYLPSLLGGSVGLAIVWDAMFSRDGAFNGLLALFGITGEPWVDQPSTALWTLVLLGAWQFGAPMVIFIAGLKQIPTELYEAADVDGAGRWRRFISITLPSLSPVIFFNLVLEVINAFQGFTSAFVIGEGRGAPSDSTLMYTVLLYNKGWTELKMGYASAMAWVFLLVIGLVTVLLFSTGRFWVHYADGDDR